jgi:dynein light chain Tctex-type 1
MQSVENTIGVNAYQHNKVNQWTSNILEACLKRLAALNKPFKYIGIYVCCSGMPFPSRTVTATILQKNGAGLHTSSSCFWDNATDGSALLFLVFI